MVGRSISDRLPFRVGTRADNTMTSLPNHPMLLFHVGIRHITEKSQISICQHRHQLFTYLFIEQYLVPQIYLKNEIVLLFDSSTTQMKQIRSFFYSFSFSFKSITVIQLTFTEPVSSSLFIITDKLLTVFCLIVFSIVKHAIIHSLSQNMDDLTVNLPAKIIISTIILTLQLYNFYKNIATLAVTYFQAHMYQQY